MLGRGYIYDCTSTRRSHSTAVRQSRVIAPPVRRLIHYVTYFSLTLGGNPEDWHSTGLH